MWGIWELFIFGDIPRFSYHLSPTCAFVVRRDLYIFLPDLVIL